LRDRKASTSDEFGARMARDTVRLVKVVRESGAKGGLRRAPADIWLEVTVMRDVKDVIGVIMRVLDGAEISEDDVLDLEFEADGELLAALNEAYINLLEFVHDRDRRLNDSQLDQRARATLREVLGRIVHLSDAASE
jgi:hypothetical protein